MTFEEMQAIIQGMLAVQRDLQEGQMKLQESQKTFDENQKKLLESQAQTDQKIDRLTEKIDNLSDQVGHLNVVSQRHEDRFTQFYGYHQSSESDRLHIRETQNQIVARLDAIEDKLDAR